MISPFAGGVNRFFDVYAKKRFPRRGSDALQALLRQGGKRYGENAFFFEKKIVNGRKVWYTPRRVDVPHDEKRPCASKEGFNVKRENCLKVPNGSKGGKSAFGSVSVSL